MKLSTTHIVFIVQSILLLVLFFIIIFKKDPEPYINYNKIRMNMQETINVLKYEFDQLSEENTVLYSKIDSLKFIIPNNKKNLEKISRELNKLKNAYTTTNYSDSSDVALIRRLSSEEVCVDRYILERVANKLDSFEVAKKFQEQCLRFRDSCFALTSVQQQVIDNQEAAIGNQKLQIGKLQDIELEHNEILKVNDEYIKHLTKEKKKLKNKIYYFSCWWWSIDSRSDYCTADKSATVKLWNFLFLIIGEYYLYIFQSYKNKSLIWLPGDGLAIPVLWLLKIIMEYNETDDLLLGIVNGPEYNRTATAYVVNGTANIDSIYYYVGGNTNSNNEVKLKLYSDGIAEIIKEEIK